MPLIDEAEARRYLDRHAALFDLERRGCFVDPEVFVYGGAQKLDPTRTGDWTVPDGPSVYVDGDLVVDGVLYQPFRAAPLWVEGDLVARHLVTCGYIAVRGNVVIDGVFYGNCTNYCTMVFGDFRAHALVLEKNHHFAAMGAEMTAERFEDEEDPDGTEAWMEALGVDVHDEEGVAEALRAGRWEGPSRP